jgi:hypothetical protein
MDSVAIARKRGRYSEIVENAFAQTVPQWESMSDWDPMKLLSESLICALSEVELRHERRINGLVQRLPGLLGFKPKPPRFPTALLSVSLAAKRLEALAIPAGTHFRFHSPSAGSATYFRTTRDYEVAALDAFEALASENRVALRFRPRGKSVRARVCFVPDGSSLVPQLVSSSSTLLSVHTGGAGGPVEYEIGFPEKNSEGWSECELVFDACPQGRWEVNTVEAEVVCSVSELKLGELRGEAWESLALPTEIVEIPEKVRAHFPDGSSRMLRRQENEVLLLRESQPMALVDTYFYSPMEHALVFPDSDSIVGLYEGGVIIEVEEATVKPEGEALPVASAFSNDSPREIAAVRPVCRARAFQNRERTQEYLGRFYESATSRNVSRTAAFVLGKVCKELVGAFDSLLSVETLMRGEETVFRLLLSEGTLAAEATGMVGQVQLWLESRLPIGEVFSVELFKKRLVTLHVGPSCNLAPSEALARARSLLLPPPMGTLEVGTILTASEVLTHILVNDAGAVLTTGTEMLFQNALSRAAGEIFEIRFDGLVGQMRDDAST